MTPAQTTIVLSAQPEMVLDKIERCLRSATNTSQLQTTQVFLGLYFRHYGHPLPEREQTLHEQLFAQQQRLEEVC